MSSEDSPPCTHDWETCPVHSLPDGELPDFATVLACAYGGAETVDGTPFDESDAEEVVGRVIRRLES